MSPSEPNPPRIALATAAVAWEVDHDGPALLEAFEAAGVLAEPAVWHDPTIEWAAYDLVVIRSTWDYTDRLNEFLAWVDRVGDRIVNPAALVRWNVDKHYLRELATAGMPVVPTRFLEPGEEPDTFPTGGFVVKPTCSAGSRDSARYGDSAAEHERARRHARALLAAGRPVMVQPYVAEVDEHGETGMLFFDGHFSHAFRKGPLLQVGGGPVEGLFAEEEIEPRTPSPEETALGTRVLDVLRTRCGGEAPLYARVDVLPTPEGPVVLEVELTEPSFFLSTDPAAAARFVAAVASRLRAAP